MVLGKCRNLFPHASEKFRAYMLLPSETARWAGYIVWLTLRRNPERVVIFDGLEFDIFFNQSLSSSLLMLSKCSFPSNHSFLYDVLRPPFALNISSGDSVTTPNPNRNVFTTALLYPIFTQETVEALF